MPPAAKAPAPAKHEKCKRCGMRHAPHPLWPAVPLQGDAFKALRKMIDNGGFWAQLSDGEPDDGKQGRRFFLKHGCAWLNALHPFRGDDEPKMTPLHNACMDGDDWRTIRALLNFGADPNIRAEDGEPPLFMLVASESRLRSVDIMLDAGADPHAEYRGTNAAEVLRALTKASEEDAPIPRIIWEAVKDRLL